MAAGAISLAELATINNKNLSGAINDELLEAAPVVMSHHAQVASQSNVHQWLRYDDPPPVGWRALNDGRVQGSTSDKNVTLALSILDAGFTVDVASGTGHINGTEALLAREGLRHLRTAFQKLERSYFYGQTALGDSAGMTGIIDDADTAVGALADDMVVNSGGTTASVQTSVYFMRRGFSDMSIATGNNGDIRIGASMEQRVAGAIGFYTAWTTPMHAWYALQYGGRYSAGRICNVETTLTDDMIADAISKFPSDRQANVMCMNRSAAALLRKSRTATNPSGQPAPFVESAFGIPVIITDQILSTEAVVV